MFIGKGKLYVRRSTWYARLLTRMGVKQKYIDKISKPYVPMGTCTSLKIEVPDDQQMNLNLRDSNGRKGAANDD